MAKKRMICGEVLDTDDFKCLPLTTQALYFHLNLVADDDGFIGGIKTTAKSIGASPKDIKLLLEKRFLLGFDDGVVVIKHWRIHNAIKKDRYTPTRYTEHMARLAIKKNGAYTEANKPNADSVTEDRCVQNGAEMETKWSQDGNKMEEVGSVGKNRLDKVRLSKDSNYIYITADRAISFLNSTCKKNYLVSSKENLEFIKNRIADGFTLDDFKKVITKKAAEWMGTEMEQFLRPETLFGAKFEGYLNQPEPKVKGTKQRNYDFESIEKEILNQ